MALADIDADVVQPLIDTTYVVKDEEKGVYRINGELFQWVVSEIVQ